MDSSACTVIVSSTINVRDYKIMISRWNPINLRSRHWNLDANLLTRFAIGHLVIQRKAAPTSFFVILLYYNCSGSFFPAQRVDEGRVLKTGVSFDQRVLSLMIVTQSRSDKSSRLCYVTLVRVHASAGPVTSRSVLTHQFFWRRHKFGLYSVA